MSATPESALRDSIELPPMAPILILMHSLLSVGYSTAAALADLVDNGAANAASGQPKYAITPSPRYLAIFPPKRVIASVAALCIDSHDIAPFFGIDLASDRGRIHPGRKKAPSDAIAIERPII